MSKFGIKTALGRGTAAHTKTSTLRIPGTRRTPWLIVMLALSAGALTCFTADGLRDQPCENKGDCNALAGVIGDELECKRGVCGYSRDCGDGIVDASEDCDDGNDIDNDECPNNCTKAMCGDGMQEGLELCDDGNLMNDDGCSSTCLMENCGDGIKNDGVEDCDDGNTKDGDGCSAACEYESCGDGVVQDPEECDDGNEAPSDGCVSCNYAVCGDGVTWAGQEECDDHNDQNDDSCLNDCTLATCGDGLVQEAEEECDDGNDIDIDACKSDCKANSCGDGIVQEGKEKCDDGNDIDADPCKSDCTLNSCGDGIVNPSTEGCDDPNIDDNDGCSNDCRLGAQTIAASPSSRHFCVTRDGEVRCWGDGSYGKLGYGSEADVGDDGPGNDLPPKKVFAGIEDGEDDFALQISPGESHTCAVFKKGGVSCWGYGKDGRLGIPGVTVNRGDDPGELPTPAVLQDAIAVDVRVGIGFACARTNTSKVYCWGDKAYGQLGKPDFDIDEPVELQGDVSIGDDSVKQLSVGANHACTLHEGGLIHCWGRNQNGQLGLGHKSVVDGPPSDEPYVRLGEGEGEGGGEEAVQIATGGNHTCALLADKERVRCWGRNDYGQLGYLNGFSMGAQEHPFDKGDVKVVENLLKDLAEEIVELAAGRNHTCVLLDEGDVYCWGAGFHGALGQGSFDDIGDDLDDTATKVKLGGAARQIALGFGSNCALLEGGRVRCWGDNTNGQLGIGGTVDVGQKEDYELIDATLYEHP